MPNEISSEVLAALRPDAIRRSDSELVQKYQSLMDSLEEEAKRAFLEERDPDERDRKQKKYLKVSSWRIREDLHPLAYDGDPLRASVLYLTANPSYGEFASNETHYQPDPDWPLSVANPGIHPPTAEYYQGTVFSHLFRAGVTPNRISLKMLKVELSPWASRGFPESAKLLDVLATMPSNRSIARLVGSLANRVDVVIIKQAAKHWKAVVPRLAELEGKTVFVSKAPVGAYISENVYGKEGWDLLVKTFKA